MPQSVHFSIWTPTHAIIGTLAERAKRGDASADELLSDAAHILFDQARIIEGEIPKDPSDFARRLGGLNRDKVDITVTVQVRGEYAEFKDAS